MATRVLYWICGKCGFKNHPRMSKPNEVPVDDQLCEQCGTSVTDANFPSQKYTPA